MVHGGGFTLLGQRFSGRQFHPLKFRAGWRDCRVFSFAVDTSGRGIAAAHIFVLGSTVVAPCFFSVERACVIKSLTLLSILVIQVCTALV